MSNKLFVGNLAYQVTDTDLNDLFSQYGKVVSCNIATDKSTGRSRGFGFVEMESQTQSETAIEATNGIELAGRQLSVVVSVPKVRTFGAER